MAELKQGKEGVKLKARKPPTADARRRLLPAPTGEVDEAEKAYQTELRHFRAELFKILAGSISNTARQDSVEKGKVGEIRELIDRSRKRFEAKFKKIARKVDFRITDKLGGILTIDPAILVGGGEEALKEYVRRNVKLIKNLEAETAEELIRFLRSEEAGDLHAEDLAKELREKFGLKSEARAKLWARDQTLKLNAQITQERYKKAGIEEYIWTVTGGKNPGARVRKSHKELNGKRFKFSNPPTINGRKVNPGEDYQCRCTAFPVI